MDETEKSGHRAAPRIIVHSFETAKGAAQPIKSGKTTLTPGTATRRSHSKSRAGCSRCKQRRIKCDEGKPACSRCAHGEYSCRYAFASKTTKTTRSRNSDQTHLSDTSVAFFPSMTSDTFTLLDMRFFHHFLIKARPHLPVGNEIVWAREIPQLAHQHFFLMYAFLALGSSHLGRLVDNEPFQVQALTYRVKGLEGLRCALAQDSWNYGHADSLIAAAYALMLQAAHIEDGLYDWISLLRLVVSISRKISADEDMSTEFDLRPTHHYEYIAPYLHLLPPVHPHLLSSGIEALADLSPELSDSHSVVFCGSLKETIRAQQASAQEGYLTLGANFGFWLDLPDEAFAECVDSLNGEMQLLMAYFLSILLMVLPQGVVENHAGMEWHNARHIDGMLGWIRHCLQNVPCPLKDHTRFVESVLESAVAETNGLPFPGPPVLQLDAAHDLHLKIKALHLR